MQTALQNRPVASSEPAMIDIGAFQATPLAANPYEHVIVPGFVRAAAFERIVGDYPVIRDRGSFPLDSLSYGPAFRQLLDELQSDAFRQVVAKKFSVDLEGKPTMITVRGKCGRKDGYVHTDGESKILTLLLYMNHSWEDEGGRLRLLRSKNINDVAAEVPPGAGTLLIFKRSDHSFHGHKRFIGTRRVLQLNWVTDQKVIDYNYARHGWSAFVKNLFSFGYRP
jgi:hypothetical protein